MQIREGEKSIFEVLSWYNEIINFILDYISLSIHDSDVSDFYRLIIGFKNILRSVEFSGKSGIYALRYLSQGYIEREHHHDFIRYEMLRKEYLSQTFNFMQDVRIAYEENAKEQVIYSVVTAVFCLINMHVSAIQFYEEAQVLVQRQLPYARYPNDSLRASVDYFSQLFENLSGTKGIVDKLASDIEVFVARELSRFEGHKTIPLSIIVSLILFVPIVAYVTLQATTSMFK